MEENRARRVADTLRRRGTDAYLLKAGVYQFGVRVVLPDGREANWDTDGTKGLEAQVMRDGMLVGFVPSIDGSDDFDEDQVVDAIVRGLRQADRDATAHRSPAERAVGADRRSLPPLLRRIPLPLSAPPMASRR